MARVVGDLSVALEVSEMVRQLHALPLAITINVLVESKSRKIGEYHAKLGHGRGDGGYLTPIARS